MPDNSKLLTIAVAVMLVGGSFAGVVAATGGSGANALAGVPGFADDRVDANDGAALAAAELNVSYEEALAAADEPLVRSGNYSLTAVKIKPPVYEFEFVYANDSTVGEAEVVVDGESGEIVESEQEYEPRDGDDAVIGIEVVEGTPAPGATLTAKLTLAGEPLTDVPLEVDEEVVGSTNENGTVQFDLPEDSESKLTAEVDDAEGELEFEFEDAELDDDALTVEVVEGTPTPGETVTLSASVDGTPVEGATVAVNDDRVGQTDANGTLAVDLPASEDVDIDVEFRDAEAELEFEFEEEDEEEEEEEDEGEDENEGEDEDENEGEDEDEDERNENEDEGEDEDD